MRRMCEPKRRKEEEAGENYTMNNFIITFSQPHIIIMNEISFLNTVGEFDNTYTGCPTRYRNQHFFNSSNTHEYNATKFEQGSVRCVRNEEECVCSVRL
jgi:hypothetical protein